MAAAVAKKGGLRKSKAKAQAKVRFNQKLVLNQLMLAQVGVDRFETLSAHLKDESLEGMDAHNIHRFHHALCLHVPADLRPNLPDAVLLDFDQSIGSVTSRLNDRRITFGEAPIVWKYFQYLALLFTEIYLDWYFRDPAGLRSALNARIALFNEAMDEDNRLTPLDETDEPRTQLNKLAFWMATGSGKTLLMHAHILQYRRFLERHGQAKALNRIILLTPNEGLSAQHLREFKKAGIDAEIFNKNGRGLFAGHAVEILEVTKLKDEMGEKTVAIDAFEGNNLVLVDEGHRGASGGGDGTWMRYRNALCEKGFSFEYSATFGQAVKGSESLANVYARGTLVDYSYRWFYGDGFGKDYHILNLESDRDEEWMATYMVACLLAFFQQQRLYEDSGTTLRPFNLERPLWIFVGGSVTATLSSREAPDIVAILQFLAGFVSNRQASVGRIKRVLSDGLVTSTGTDIVGDRFVYLRGLARQPEAFFDEILSLLFNAPNGGALHVEHLKGADGEVALRVGDHEPFGLVNVGDAAKLVKLCETNGLNTGDREFSGSMFQELDRPDSKVNVLIGAKKFTEGWSSWRVSTMGLMNVGQGEGAQIIQLFGRGVRLKGLNMSLKRSGAVTLFDQVERPKHIKTLETLHIFGIRANYMAQFRDFLEEEGLPSEEERTEFVLPVLVHLGARQLRMVRLKKTIMGRSTDGDAFKRLGPIATVRPPDRSNAVEAKSLLRVPLVVNWYPKVQAIRSRGIADADHAKPHEAVLSPRHAAFLDMDRLLFELERYKAERSWYNLNITREGIQALLNRPDWYRLQIPEASLAFTSFDAVRQWQEIALALLKKYVERFYLFHKREWELPHLEYRDLESTDPNLLYRDDDPDNSGYRISVETSQADVIARLEELRDAIVQGKARELDYRGLKALWLNRHLYEPLLTLGQGVVEIRPAPLNTGERLFVEDLKRFCDMHPEFFANRELYVLRNLSRGKGVGFFEAGNFYPDFIVWQVEGEKQYVSFVDPKGILNLGPTDEKLTFRTTIQEIADRLGDPNVRLSSFIVSVTPSAALEQRWGMTKEEMDNLDVVFQTEDRDSYIETILTRARAVAG